VDAGGPPPHFSGSKDLTTVVFRNAGHFPQFSRAAPEFHAAVAEWLRSRRFLSAGALTADGCPAANRTTAGGRGADRVRGTTAPDNLSGHGGNDWYFGAAGDDCLRGGAGKDLLRGGRGGDVLMGDSGHDVLGGGPGGDRVDAGGGRDRIDVADGERDRVRCGAGRDRVRADRRDGLTDCERVRRTVRSVGK
jgi:Ca2+-binding RTX toxin-like protein